MSMFSEDFENDIYNLTAENIRLREQVKLLTQYLSEDRYDMLRIIATVKYLRGIAERGTGRLCDDNETVEQFVLGYVKKLEGQIKVLREALEDSRETIQSHLNTMPTYTQDGWGIERFDFEGEYLGFEQVNPDYVIQGFH